VKAYNFKPLRILKTQLLYAPEKLRKEQVSRLENLIVEINSDEIYAYDYICVRITGYKPEKSKGARFPGEPLREDLIRLLDDLSRSLRIGPDEVEEEVVDLKEVTRRYRVSGKTIARWRKEGLAGRRLLCPDGAWRIAFRRSVLEHFVKAHPEKVKRSAEFSRISPEEKGEILNRVIELAQQDNFNFSKCASLVAKEFCRSPQTIRSLLKKLRQENPRAALIPRPRHTLTAGERQEIVARFNQGAPVSKLARRFGKDRSTIYRIIYHSKFQAIERRNLDFIMSPEFENPKKVAEITRDIEEFLQDGDPTPEEKDSLVLEPNKKAPRTSHLAAYFEDLKESAPLSKEEEARFFRAYNYCKYRATKAREASNPHSLKCSQLAEAEKFLNSADTLYDRIVSANLRLVVTIARRHLPPGRSSSRLLSELISDGNLALLRAADKFDYTRQHKFSTYAGWAIVRQFARTLPEKVYSLGSFSTGDEEFLTNLQEQASYTQPQEKRREAPTTVILSPLRTALSKLLRRLTERERKVIVSRFGLKRGEQPKTLEEVGLAQGLTKERIRQIEKKALAKMRREADTDLIELIPK
jgi:RNA polymerase primary sigma factor/RNA polymerase sigma factor